MKHLVLSLATVTLLAACAGDSAETTMDTDTSAMAGASAGAMSAPAAAPAAAAATVTDPQIAAIVVAANDADIKAGRLAASKSTNAEVKRFGQMMVTDHEGVNKAAVALVTKLNVTPEENAVSRQQMEAGQQNLTNLQGLSGAAFDRAYIANEVTYHQGLLQAMSQTLIPSAQNAELKALLEQTRPVVEAHLRQAQQIQTSLGQG